MISQASTAAKLAREQEERARRVHTSAETRAAEVEAKAMQLERERNELSAERQAIERLRNEARRDAEKATKERVEIEKAAVVVKEALGALAKRESQSGERWVAEHKPNLNPNPNPRPLGGEASWGEYPYPKSSADTEFGEVRDRDRMGTAARADQSGEAENLGSVNRLQRPDEEERHDRSDGAVSDARRTVVEADNLHDQADEKARKLERSQAKDGYGSHLPPGRKSYVPLRLEDLGYSAEPLFAEVGKGDAEKGGDDTWQALVGRHVAAAELVRREEALQRWARLLSEEARRRDAIAAVSSVSGSGSAWVPLPLRSPLSLSEVLYLDFFLLASCRREHADRNHVGDLKVHLSPRDVTSVLQQKTFASAACDT